MSCLGRGGTYWHIDPNAWEWELKVNERACPARTHDELGSTECRHTSAMHVRIIRHSRPWNTDCSSNIHRQTTTQVAVRTQQLLKIKTLSFL